MRGGAEIGRAGLLDGKGRSLSLGINHPVPCLACHWKEAIRKREDEEKEKGGEGRIEG